jgi:hypothetical protein
MHLAMQPVGSDGRICYGFNVLQRNFLRMLVLLVLCAGCGRNERMDTVYAQRCFNCHGHGGGGDGPLAASLPMKPPDFRETVQRKTNSQIRKVIAEGAGVMPAFGPVLRPSEINDMLQMVRFLSREGRDLAWWEKFDTLVVAHCSIPWETVLGYDEAPETPKP